MEVGSIPVEGDDDVQHHEAFVGEGGVGEPQHHEAFVGEVFPMHHALVDHKHKYGRTHKSKNKPKRVVDWIPVAPVQGLTAVKRGPGHLLFHDEDEEADGQQCIGQQHGGQHHDGQHHDEKEHHIGSCADDHAAAAADDDAVDDAADDDDATQAHESLPLCTARDVIQGTVLSYRYIPVPCCPLCVLSIAHKTTLSLPHKTTLSHTKPPSLPLTLLLIPPHTHPGFWKLVLTAPLSFLPHDVLLCSPLLKMMMIIIMIMIMMVMVMVVVMVVVVVALMVVVEMVIVA